MEGNRIRLSIIVPVYNVENYLKDCLDSLLDQDIPKEEYEIICINDGSKDNSLEILRQYESENENFKVVDQPNRGVSATRNTGIELSRGKYLWMVDPDDKVRSNCLSSLLENVYGQEALFFGYELINESDFGLKSKELSYTLEEIHEKNRMMPVNISANGVYNKGSYVWGMIVKKDFLLSHDIKFNEKMSEQEDNLLYFFMRIFLNKCVFYNEIIYYYRQRSDSVMHRKTKERKMGHYNSLRELCNVYNAELKKGIYSSEVQKELLLRKNHCTEGVVFALLSYEDDFIKQELAKLKEDGLYPYDYRTDCLKFWTHPTIKIALLSMSKFLLCKEWYFNIYKRILKKTK